MFFFFSALLLWPGISLLVIILYDTPDLHVYLGKPTYINKQMNRCQSRCQTASLWLERTGEAGVTSPRTGLNGCYAIKRKWLGSSHHVVQSGKVCNKTTLRFWILKEAHKLRVRFIVICNIMIYCYNFNHILQKKNIIFDRYFLCIAFVFFCILFVFFVFFCKL